MKFSIITCTYNSEKYLKENIDSVVNQSFADYEHIFIDGNSSDGTMDIINKYKKENPDKVEVYQYEPKGISHAMNRGIEQASGEYLIHMHADDNFFDESVLSDTDNFLKEKNNPDWIYGLANVIEENGDSVSVYPDKPFVHFRSSESALGKYFMKLLQFVPHQAVFIKKEVFEKFGNFDESISSMMDPDMWKRINYKTNWTFYKRIVCNYRIRPGAQSSGKEREEENRKNNRKIQKRHLNILEYYLMGVVNIIQEIRNKHKR